MLSVIIPVYNKAGALRRAVASVLRQDVPVEIVVVDDGSDDAPHSVIGEFGDTVTYIRQVNRGPSAARNRGAEESHSPQLLFLDADDEILPGCLAAHLRCRASNPLARATVSLTSSLKAAIHRRPREFTRTGEYYYSRRYLHDIVSGVPCAAICIDRDLHVAISGFDEDLRCWEITNFMSRILAASPIVGILEQNYVRVHHDTGLSQFRSLQHDRRFRALYAVKALDSLHVMSRDERHVAVRRTRGTVRSLLLSGGLREAHQVLTELRRTCGWREVFGPTYLLSLLPPGILAALAAAHRRFTQTRLGRSARVEPGT